MIQELSRQALGTTCHPCLRVGHRRVGGAEGNRTPDLCSAIAALSHLSYGPAMGAGIYVAGPGIVKKRGRRCPRFLADGRWRLPRDGAAHGRALVARSHQGRWIGAASPLVAERREHYTRGPHGPQSRSMPELLDYISALIWLYIYIIFAGVVMSWLM